MCGIVGVCGWGAEPVQEQIIRQMLAMIKHRGPDQFGLYIDDSIGMGSARLSIIDLHSGQQPITNETNELWIVFNGEIYNYPELRTGLEARGHRFSTETDTEVILHLFEDLGPQCLERLNGQFSIAIWDRIERQLFLARDRVGIRPLFYSQIKGELAFASEIKALFVNSRLHPCINHVALEQVFTYWGALSPNTIFNHVYEVPPGHYLLVDEDGLTVEKYYELEFPEEESDISQVGLQATFLPGWSTDEEYLDAFRALLIEATQIRLRADVPVGAYLSGGLDSSTIAAIIRKHTNRRLDTFSIAFADAEFDERQHQIHMAKYLGTDHHVVEATSHEIGAIFPEVIWHTETPILRTSPAPMYLLSRLVHANQYKVVLTGEGADEFLAGYNIYKEDRVRRFWSKNPTSQIRPLLLQRLYPYITDLAGGKDDFLKAFFGRNLTNLDSLLYSHILRWENSRRLRRFFSGDLLQKLSKRQDTWQKEIPLPEAYSTWTPLSRAQYLEATIFMTQYLLSSQGDRVAMAHSVEGRFPFLDHRVIEFCNHLPEDLKLFGLREKRLLKMVARELIPEEIWRRPKRPYRAPIHRSFFSEPEHEYVDELLSTEMISKFGLFNSKAVSGLVKKVRRGRVVSEMEDMAVVGILSTQLLYSAFVEDFPKAPPISENESLKRCDMREVVQ